MRLNNDREHLDSWLKGNKLSLNVAKTVNVNRSQTEHQTLNNAAEKLHLEIRGSELDVVNKAKYLGVHVENSLGWKEHIKVVSTKLSRAIGFLKHAKNILPIASLKILYSSIVEPHFRYCCSVWGCCGKTYIDQPQKLQNRAARIVTNNSFDAPSRPLIESIGWKTVRELVDQESRPIIIIHLIYSRYHNFMISSIIKEYDRVCLIIDIKANTVLPWIRTKIYFCLSLENDF